MGAQHLLFLDSHQLGLYRWHPGELQELARHPLNNAGQTALARWLEAHPDTQLRLLVNLAEEGFQVETLPYLHGADRRAVLERRQAQHFFGTPYVLEIPLGHLQTQRKEERVLLAALTQPTLLDPWLQLLQQKHIPFAGLYSLPQLTSTLCRLLDLPRERCLVLTVHSHGLRESLVMGGETVFSRLTPLADRSIAGMAGSIAAEAHKLQQYLSSQRLIGRNEQLTVCPLVHRQALEALSQTCQNQAPLVFQPLELEQTASRLGYRWVPDDSLADPLFLYLLAGHPPQHQFAPALLRQDYQLARLRRGLLALGLTILALGLVLLGQQLNDIRRLQDEQARMEAAADKLQAEYGQLLAGIPGLSLGKEQLRRLLEQYDRMQQGQPLAQAMEALSHALDEVPEARLERLLWLHADRQNTLTVEGSLPPGSPRQQVRHFEDLLLALDKRNIRNEVLNHPVDMAPDKPLRGGDQDADNTPIPSFRLRLHWEAQP
ncbi:hypothetical protein [Azovibrio restrictus]|uniref:hypothetical protein n=1 Tax=Azovibrio restrictus TaxID=146938 RepID=UPI0026EAFD0C|nr:hypothetical protein [Azovibrio restrictus]MDD3481562.1 hypothetical protein [Azovibrio restrictus]